MKTIKRKLMVVAMTVAACALFYAVGHYLFSQHQRNRELFANLERVSAIATGKCDYKNWVLEVTERISDPKVITPILDKMKHTRAARVKGMFSGLQGPYLFLAANGEPVYWVWYCPEERYLRLMGAERKADRYKAVLEEDKRGYITVVDYPGFPDVINKLSVRR